jgi:hypothetical protein
MITFVNGFLCASSCDVSKAKHGVDPHQQTDGAQNSAKPESSESGAAATGDSAVVLDGALKALPAVANIASANIGTPSAPAKAIDLLV